VTEGITSCICGW